MNVIRAIKKPQIHFGRLISAVFSFHTTVKNNLLSSDFPYYQPAVMTAAAS